MSKEPAEASNFSNNYKPGLLGPLAKRMSRNRRILELVSLTKAAIEVGNLTDLQERISQSLTDWLLERSYDGKIEVFDHLKHQLAKSGISASLIWREPYDGNAHVVFMSKDGSAAKVLTVSTDLNEAPTAICYSPSGSVRLDPGSMLLEFKSLLAESIRSDKPSYD